MRVRLVMCAVLLCLAAFEAGAQKISVYPKGRTFYLDDVIEITISLGRKTDTWVSMPTRYDALNLDVQMNDFAIDGRVTIRVQLTPRDLGLASFGPAVFVGRDGQAVVAKLPRMTFDILPPLDDGTAPVEDVLALQRRNKRHAAVIRPEVDGERSLGRPMIFRWVLYSEGPIHVVTSPRFELLAAARTRSRGSSGPAEWTSLGGTMVSRMVLEETIVLPEGTGTIEVNPAWATLAPRAESPEGSDPTRIRRRGVVPPVEIGPRLSEEDIPAGSFEIECPTSALFTTVRNAKAGVRISGDGDLSSARLRLTGSTPTPILMGQRGLHEPEIRDGRPRMVASFDVFAMPVPEGQAQVAFPEIAFDYFDPVQKRKATLTCGAAVLRTEASQYSSKREPAKVVEKEIPPEAETFLYVLQGAGVLFVLLTGFGLRRAITRV